MSIGGYLQQFIRAASLQRPTVPTDRSLPDAAADAPVRVTFLGNATLLFDDGETQLMTDGFFSRPGAIRTLVGRLHSDPKIVASCLRRAQITRLAAVFPLHTHYDHVLDASRVALETGAQFLASNSAVMVGRGVGVPEERLVPASDGQSYPFGRFTLTVIASAHVPPERLSGTIDRPLKVPARVSSYRMGDCYSLLIEHDGRRMLVQGSAGAIPGSFQNHRADVAFLAVGALSKQPPDYRNRYWNEVVAAVGARRVLPIHWDDFSKPLSRTLVPLPYLFDNFTETIRFLDARAAETGVDVRLPEAWRAVDPFIDLERP